MTAVPLLNGVAASEGAEFVQTYPTNLEPVIIDSKISKGQLKSPPGAIQIGTAFGDYGGDRGGIFWNGRLYRVFGTLFVAIDPDGTQTPIGDPVIGGGPTRCWFDYSFDRLAVGGGGGVWYYTPGDGLFPPVVDEDLGIIIDGLWIDGYFMMTDGTYVIVTDLSDPTSIQPLKYGSAEEDPDSITGLLKYRNEAYIFGRNTIQTLQNVGGNGFPFAARIGASIPFGCVAPAAKCLFGDGFAFVGSPRNEGLDVYLGTQGVAKAIGSRGVCDALAKIADPSIIEVEARNSRAERRLLIHLPTETWVFLLNASALAGEPVWYRVKTDANGYRLRNAVQAYGQSIVGDVVTGHFGYLTDADNRHFGVETQWEFEAGLIYNEALGAILHSVELVGLPGRGGTGNAFMSMTRDGETWSIERAVQLKPGARSRRIAWRPHARIGNYLGLKFRGTGRALPGFAACEAKLAPLSS